MGDKMGPGKESEPMRLPSIAELLSGVENEALQSPPQTSSERSWLSLLRELKRNREEEHDQFGQPGLLEDQQAFYQRRPVPVFPGNIYNYSMSPSASSAMAPSLLSEGIIGRSVYQMPTKLDPSATGPSGLLRHAMSMAPTGTTGKTIEPRGGLSEDKCEASGREPEQDRMFWNSDEDALLRSLVEKHGASNWQKLAKMYMPKRTGKQLRSRWLYTLQRQSQLPKRFSPKEDAMILELYAKYGRKWAIISRYIPDRSDQDIKHRFAKLERKMDRSREDDKYSLRSS